MRKYRFGKFSGLFTASLSICLLQTVVGWPVCLAADVPKTVMVAPKDSCRDMKFAKQIKEMIEGHLKSSDWKLIDAKLLKRTRPPKSAKVTPLSKIIKANIIVEFEFSTKKRKDNTKNLILAVWALESVSGRKLAAETGISPDMADPGDAEILSAYRELTDDVMKSVLSMMKEHLAADKKHGKRFIVTFNNPPKRTDMRMSLALRRACRPVKLTVNTKTQVSFYAQCKLSKEEMLNVVKVCIAEKLGGAKYELMPAPEGQIVVAFE
jgi:uncharacterized protein DUF6175